MVTMTTYNNNKNNNNSSSSSSKKKNNKKHKIHLIRNVYVKEEICGDKAHCFIGLPPKRRNL